MSWLGRYRTRHILENSICFFPIVALLGGIVAARLLNWVDSLGGWKSSISPDVARTVLVTLASVMFSCVVFVSSALLLVVQLASAQLTPRIIGRMFRDTTTKFSMTLFVFTFSLSMTALVRIGDSVPKLTTMVATYACVASLGTLLYLIDHVGMELRPSGALRTVARAGRAVIETVYKRALNEVAETVGQNENPPADSSWVLPSPRHGVVMAVDIEGLALLAAGADSVIEMVPQVGQFVAAGDTLFRVFGKEGAIPAHRLRESIALGQERTLEQDPTLAFRIIVDIACKALSPAINDPTTAVLAIDQIQHLLRTVGRRKLDEGRVPDANGNLRLIYPRPSWEDYVTLSATEIRQFGSQSIQIARRLKAMLIDLIRSLPEHRAPELRRQLDLLHRTSERSFAEAEDRHRANIADAQGVGGSAIDDGNGIPSEGSRS